MWRKDCFFKENISNLNFTSVELRHWQVICVELLQYLIRERSGIEVKSPKEVIITAMVGVYNCSSYITHKSRWFKYIVKWSSYLCSLLVQKCINCSQMKYNLALLKMMKYPWGWIHQIHNIYGKKKDLSLTFPD